MPSSVTRRRCPPAGGSLTAYFSDISAYPLLTRQEEAELARRGRDGDESALEALVCSNLRFVVAVAKTYERDGALLEDLISEGNIGLMRAALRFDPAREVKFISYAVWWVRQAIGDALAQQSHIVRLPAGRAAAMHAVGKHASARRQELGRDPTNREIATELSVTEHEVDEAARLSRSHLSLDAPAANTDTQLLDYIADDSCDEPDEPVQRDARIEAVYRALSSLRPQEAQVLRSCFGLDGSEPMTLDEIAAMLGVTRARVRQIKDTALLHLRHGHAAAGLAALAG